MRLFRPLFPALLAALALTALAAVDAAAQTAICRPWCIFYGRSGAANCSFVSFEQCKWTAAENTDICMPNGQCPPQSTPPRR
jgi:Protein of unknown function (DUF3551)